MAEKTHGKTASGVPITDELVDELAEAAEAGYDVDALVRLVGRPVKDRRGKARAVSRAGDAAVSASAARRGRAAPRDEAGR
jgi:hypothetical protein